MMTETYLIIDETMRELDSILESRSDNIENMDGALDQEESKLIASLKKESEERRQQNLRLLAAQESLLIQYEDQESILREFKSQEANLKRKIADQKASLNFLFADLQKAKKRVEWLEAKLSSTDPSCDTVVVVPREERLSDRQEDFLPATKPEQKNGASLLSSLISKDFLVEQQTIRQLQEENAKLKSDFVRLQAEYKQDLYVSRHTIEDLMGESMTAATESSSDEGSVGSAESFFLPTSDDQLGTSLQEHKVLSTMPFSSPKKPSKTTKISLNGSGNSASNTQTAPFTPVRVPRHLQTKDSSPLQNGLFCDTRSLWRENSVAAKSQSSITPVRTTTGLFLPNLPIPPLFQKEEEREVNLHDLANEDEPIRDQCSFSPKRSLDFGLMLWR